MDPRAGSDDPSFVAATRFAGAIAWCELPRDDVAKMIPHALRLPPPPRTRGDRHPVVFIFGQHDRSAVVFASLTVRTGARFHEMVVGVPFVHGPDGAGPSLFVSRVFSGEPVATWSGNAHYGYAKRLVPMEWLGDTFVVSDEGGTLLAHVAVEPAGGWERAANSALQAHTATMALSRLPVLGQRPDGQLVRSRFEWSFADGWTRALRASVHIDAPLGPGLACGVHHAAGDSVEVSGMGWRLSWPESGHDPSSAA
jgi:hypothetical protein